MRHAVYILNRVPTRALTGVTPYEAWSKKKPQVAHIKVFGCKAYMKIPSVHVRKLDDRSKPVVYLGKEPGTKAHRAYDPMLKKVHVSRDLVFEEHKGWNWNVEKEHDSTGSFIIIGDKYAESNMEEHEFEASGETSPELSATGETSQSGENSEEGFSGENSGYSSESTEPRKFRLLSDIYNETEEIEIADEMLMLSVEEPSSYSHAEKDKEWRAAMEREIDAIEKNGTWELTDLPKGQKAIGLKWVYKLKKDMNGDIIKYKARLVAKGYVQKQGVDFNEVFAPVTRLETVRLLIALAAKNGWEVHHLDVKSAFLNGDLQEEVYVLQPEGFVKDGEERKVYRLLKELYGLRQAPRAWNARLNRCLMKLGFVKCPYEHAVYCR